MSNSVPDSAPKPRLCHVKKWSDFNGYGFNLHAEKGKVGQFIGKVDDDSPADAAGLKQNDRIVEVNGTNISNENHQQVVQRIKAVPNETKLLVVDAETDKYFKDEKIVIRGDMPYVEVIECPNEKGGQVIRSSPPAADSDSVDQDAPVEENEEDEEAAYNGIMSAANEVDFHVEDEEYDEGPAPRNCHLKIWPDFQGYGFNLHAEKGKPGQFIGKVDEGSPAEAAGLKQGDRIVEVNNQNISQDNHAQVVQKIKSDATQTSMLVVDEDAEEYYKSRNITVSSSMPQVKNIYCPATKAEFIDKPAQTSAAAVVAAAPTETGPYARECHLKIWPDFQGYGFNLHAEKGKGGQYIGKVDEGSPAEAAGLKQDDKIIAVNDIDVTSESHQQVVKEIKSNPSQTVLLVADKETFDWYTSRNQKITPKMSNLNVIKCPDTKPIANGQTEEVAAVVNNVDAVDNSQEHYQQPDSDPETESQHEPEEEPEIMEEQKTDVNQNEPIPVSQPEPEPHEEVNGQTEGEEAAAAIEDSIREAEQQEAEKEAAEAVAVAAAATEAAPKVEETKVEVKDEVEDDLQDYEIITKPADEQSESTVPVENGESKAEETPAVYENSETKVEEKKVVEEVKEEKKVETTVVSSTAQEVTKSEPVYEEPDKKPEAAATEPEPTTPKSPVVVGGIEFAGSVKEAREKLSKRSSRKHEVKSVAGVSMRDKYELFQKL